MTTADVPAAEDVPARGRSGDWLPRLWPSALDWTSALDKCPGLDKCPDWEMCPENPTIYPAEYDPPTPWARRTMTSTGVHLTLPAGVTDLPPVTLQGVTYHFDMDGCDH